MTVAETSTITVGIVLGALQAYNSWKQSQTNRTVDKIHELTNSAMTQQKKMLAEVTAAKAAITKDPVDADAAAEAMKDYLQQVGKPINLDK